MTGCSGHNRHRSGDVLGQTVPSNGLLKIAIDRRSGDVLLEPVQLRYWFLNLLLDIFELLQITSSVLATATDLVNTS